MLKDIQFTMMMVELKNLLLVFTLGNDGGNSVTFNGLSRATETGVTVIATLSKRTVTTNLKILLEVNS